MAKILIIIFFLSFGVAATKGQIINMPQSGWQSYITCHGVFYDSGGEFGNYSNNENGFLTLCPSDSGLFMGLLFYGGNIAPGPGDDELRIRNGLDTSGGMLVLFSGMGPPPGGVVCSTDTATGCLTMQFVSDSNLAYSGWKASIFCYYPSSPPCLFLPGYNCTYAIPISLPYSVTYETTFTHVNDQFNSQPGACITYTQGDDKFYKYVSPGSECLTVSLSNVVMPFPNSHASMSVWYGCPGSGGYCIGSYYTPVNPPTLPTLTGNFNLDSAGTYYIIIDSDGGPSEFVQYDITIVPCSVGIDEQSILTSFFISPNPSDGIFTLHTGSAKVVNFTITNMLGEKILERKIISEKTEINLINQPDGIYFATVRDEKGNKIVRKLVKM